MGTEKVVVFVEVESSTPAYMSAQEARAVAEQKLKADAQSIFENLVSRIPEYARKGEMRHNFRIDGYYATFSEQTAVVLLEQLGYKVKTSSGAGYCWYDISW